MLSLEEIYEYLQVQGIECSGGYNKILVPCGEGTTEIKLQDVYIKVGSRVFNNHLDELMNIANYLKDLM